MIRGFEVCAGCYGFPDSWKHWYCTPFFALPICEVGLGPDYTENAAVIAVQ